MPSPKKTNTSQQQLASIKKAKLVAVPEDNNLSKNSTPEDLFKPTPTMRLWIAASIQLKTDNITQIAEECGVDRKNWYLWIKRPGFFEWYDSERERLTVLIRQQLDNIGLKMAAKDFRYFEVMQKVVGRDLSDKENTQSASSSVQFNFNTTKYIKNRE